MEQLDHTELRDSVRKLLARAGEQKAAPRDAWNAMVEHGWPGLALPEACGGLGQPFTALAVVYQEIGRCLAPHTFTAISIGLAALAELNDAASRTLIGRTLAGEAMPMAIAATCLQAMPDSLRGAICNVPDADQATHLLVPIQAVRPVLAVLPLPHPQVSLRYRATWDQTRRLFDLHFDDLDLTDVVGCAGGRAAALIDRMTAQHDLALACDALGGSEAIFEETLAYMQLRRQFNRPIASFQALKHRCAELSACMAAAQALVGAACAQIAAGGSDGRDGDDRTVAACARLYANAVYRNVTEEAIQLHGGIGFTWEHRCHRFLKRARLNDALGATPEQRKDAVAPALFRAAGMV